MGPHEAFHNEHGPECVVHEGYVYYPDGAYRENRSIGVMWWGPNDLREIALNKLFFHKLMLKREIEAFDEFKDQVMSNHSAWADENAHLRRLTELQLAVRKRKKLVKAAQVEADRLSPNYRTPEVQRRDAEIDARTDQRREAFRDKVKRIEV